MGDPFEAMALETEDAGATEGRLYRVPGARRGLVCVGGVGGGWDSPAKGLYPRLAVDLQRDGLATLRVRFREPGLLAECVLDVLAGIDRLTAEGVEAVGLVGHSFGGAVVIQAAALRPGVRAVVTVATQSYGGGPIATLAPRCAALLLHGTGDRVLPPQCSRELHRVAGEPKDLRIFEDAGHGLDEVADEVHRLTRDWLLAHVQQQRAA